MIGSLTRMSKFYRKPKPETMKKNRESYAEIFKDEIKWCKENLQTLTETKNKFMIEMYAILVSGGRKITPKMENAINKIIKRNSPEEQFKRDEWVEKVVPKMIMVREMIAQTSWTEGYRSGSYRFINSVIDQAKARKSLSQKQMEAVSNLYLKVKKNLKSNW